ncbi:hypothetical protein SCARD494_10413 [Seiridium cardinale]
MARSSAIPIASADDFGMVIPLWTAFVTFFSNQSTFEPMVPASVVTTIPVMMVYAYVCAAATDCVDTDGQDRGTDDEKDSMYSEWNFNSTRPAPTTSKANISQTEQEKNKSTKSTEMIQTFASELSGIMRPLGTAETMSAMFR